jgi:hypothetical protein
MVEGRADYCVVTDDEACIIYDCYGAERKSVKKLKMHEVALIKRKIAPRVKFNT